MINVVYVGSLREDLGIEEDREEIAWSAEITDVASLIELLCRDRGERWTRALHRDNLLLSVNQAMVKGHHALSDGDEVTIFPPIAGG